jgi:acetyl esterase/lipase
MLRLTPLVLLAAFGIFASAAQAMSVKKDLRYGDEERQVLDVYAPDDAAGKKLPVVFWIHGGGWQAGDKSDVKLKPEFFVSRGCIFVSTNYRLYPNVDMATLIGDCAKSLGWVAKNIAEHGGDAGRIIVGGHSAGAQLAAILCTDDRYLKAEGVPFTSLKGCIPVDGDTYWLPAIIATAELRAHLYGTPQPGKSGHRAKFGNDPEKHLDFSAVTHIAKGKHIPPFLIMYVSGHPDTSAQARKLAAELTKAEIPNTPYGGRETTHSKLNNDIGASDDPGTAAVIQFLDTVLAR